ncbi:YueI family protein [Tetragenococcus muriaticus]|uniref:DUF1694 domain-containing protein n=2 Tax=Tetragenococcus muriaticus TaxID=64642 RepID=A0A091BY32_9ENTE|nr:YueI family protein [Tetragenococcus muriaticus]KFN89639.1 hypothetical protein TMU3MR103_1888 [Tetragenococcus muriaticus 3MR10-3]KFN89926.1 hypothetical protein TMUPMC115_2186 [Tetragenococcus muriaticus PMC-11-5]GMA47920.1 hypothetical protein GCM10025854_21700 [Tetragenococcus muriaticus]
MTDEVQKHLDKGMYGTPSVNPDEQRKFLGTFRERVYIQITIQQMRQEKLKKILDTHLTDYSDASVLINGNVSQTLQTSYIQSVMKAKLKFTVVDTDLQDDEESGLLVVSDEAVNEDTIDIAEKFANDISQSSQNDNEKKGFWRSLFHND